MRLLKEIEKSFGGLGNQTFKLQSKGQLAFSRKDAASWPFFCLILGFGCQHI